MTIIASEEYDNAMLRRLIARGMFTEHMDAVIRFDPQNLDVEFPFLFIVDEIDQELISKLNITRERLEQLGMKFSSEAHCEKVMDRLQDKQYFILLMTKFGMLKDSASMNTHYDVKKEVYDFRQTFDNSMVYVKVPGSYGLDKHSVPSSTKRIYTLTENARVRKIEIQIDMEDYSTVELLLSNGFFNTEPSSTKDNIIARFMTNDTLFEIYTNYAKENDKFFESEMYKICLIGNTHGLYDVFYRGWKFLERKFFREEKSFKELFLIRAAAANPFDDKAVFLFGSMPGFAKAVIEHLKRDPENEEAMNMAETVALISMEIRGKSSDGYQTFRRHDDVSSSERSRVYTQIGKETSVEKAYTPDDRQAIVKTLRDSIRDNDIGAARAVALESQVYQDDDEERVIGHQHSHTVEELQRDRQAGKHQSKAAASSADALTGSEQRKFNLSKKTTDDKKPGRLVIRRH
jgi:hypothetical protein